MDVAKRLHLSEYLEKNNIDIRKLGRKICIVSGVGSGKSTWVKDHLTNYGNVLLITSRKATKDETILHSIFEGKLSKDEIDRSVVITNSGIEQLVKHAVINGMGSIYYYFDYIVVDEAHSIITDSTFSNSSFHLWNFIKEVVQKKTVVLMTGTFAPIENLIKEDNWKIIDCTKDCIDLKPKKIVIDTQKNVLNSLNCNGYNSKIIYLANSAKEIKTKLYNKFYNIGTIEKADIAFGMADDKAESLLKEMPEEYERLQRTYSTIINEERLPDDIKILITTTRLKEGVNIKDTSIKEISCESHIAADLVQFAGRVRTGVDTLYIIDDIRQNYPIELTELEYNFCLENIDSCNSYLRRIEMETMDITPDCFTIKRSKTKTNDKLNKTVKLIESKYQFIRYNHFKNIFQVYELRKIAMEQAKDNINGYINNRKKYISNVFKIPIHSIQDNIKEKKDKEQRNLDNWKRYYHTYLANLCNGDIRIYDDYYKDLLIEGLGYALGCKKCNISQINEELQKQGLPYTIDKKKSNKKDTRDKYYLIVTKEYKMR